MEGFVKEIDTEYSRRLARRMEVPRTNPVLGYRTAGSKAEWETGELIAEEMRAIGLQDVGKDEIRVDSWDFHHAVMEFQDRDGASRRIQLGAYQTHFVTEGFQEFSLIWAGKGRAEDYEGLEAEGKLVLADINQRDEWWINFPVYQAHLKGARALIAVQEQGYGEICDTALNAQDIAGPPEAAAFSISRSDAALLKERLRENGGELKVRLDASSRVERDGKTWNILGTIPGKHPDSMILLSAHYDSYFSGFQDDNAAVAMLLGIARALIRSGIKPERTLVFCAMAAEEWGVADSRYDWSTGAYEEVFTVHPEWKGKVMADLNFELPAHAHDRRDGLRCTYEYASFMKEFATSVKVPPEAYPEGLEVLCPIQTWSDDFSIAISGIPSLVNDFSGGDFMETHYHSQFDNEEAYQEPVYRFHHELYGCLVMALDCVRAVPMDFERVFQAAEESVDLSLCREQGIETEALFAAFGRGKELGRRLYQELSRINREGAGEWESLAELNRRLLLAFAREQDSFVRLGWHDEVLFPQETSQNNLRAVSRGLCRLEAGDPVGALEAVYEIDNNRYAFQFEEEVFRYFTEYALDQPADRLKWGAGRIRRHENLFPLVQELKKQKSSYDREGEFLKKAAENQRACLADDIAYMASAAEKLCRELEDCLERCDTVRERTGKGTDHGE